MTENNQYRPINPENLPKDVNKLPCGEEAVKEAVKEAGRIKEGVLKHLASRNIGSSGR